MKLRILGYDYTVVTEGTMKSIGACGRLLYYKQIIQVAGDLLGETRVSVILHEIIEALSYHLELGLGHRTITSLETGLYQVLKDAGINLSLLDPEALKALGTENVVYVYCPSCGEEFEYELMYLRPGKKIQVTCPHCNTEWRIQWSFTR